MGLPDSAHVSASPTVGSSGSRGDGWSGQTLAKLVCCMKATTASGAHRVPVAHRTASTRRRVSSDHTKTAMSMTRTSAIVVRTPALAVPRALSRSPSPVLPVRIRSSLRLRSLGHSVVFATSISRAGCDLAPGAQRQHCGDQRLRRRRHDDERRDLDSPDVALPR